MPRPDGPRKGAARIALIPPPVPEALNRGEIATANLNEFLALALPALARTVTQRIGLDPDSERFADTLAMLPAFKPCGLCLEERAGLDQPPVLQAS